MLDVAEGALLGGRAADAPPHVDDTARSLERCTACMTAVAELAQRAVACAEFERPWRCTGPSSNSGRPTWTVALVRRRRLALGAVPPVPVGRGGAGALTAWSASTRSQ